ncbi:MAG: type IV pilus modification protein PilV [Burkholderiaceae bacterium]
MIPSNKTVTSQAGMSLIEVLVAMVILSFGMISFAGLQASSIKQGKMAQYRTVASQLATDFADRMRANANEAVNNASYDYPQAYAPMGAAMAVPACAAVLCTEAEIAAIDLAQWRNLARVSLPGGSLFSITDAAAPVLTAVDFWVLWQDPNQDDLNDVGMNCPPEIGNNANGPRCMHFRFSL